MRNQFNKDVNETFKIGRAFKKHMETFQKVYPMPVLGYVCPCQHIRKNIPAGIKKTDK